MYKFLLALPIALGLCACGAQLQSAQTQLQTQAVKPVAQLIAKDAGDATVLATSDKVNPQAASLRAPCYQNIGNVATGISNEQQGGLLSGVEASLEGNELVQSPNCQAVMGQVAIQLLQRTNAMVAAPAIVGGSAALLAPLVPVIP